MERIVIDFTPKFRPLTHQELVERELVRENLEPLKIEISRLGKELRTRQLKRIIGGNSGFDIICD